MNDKLDIYYLKPGNKRQEKCDACGGKVFEQKGKTASGLCVKCGLYNANVFYPKEICVICKVRTYWTHDINNNWYCSKHKEKIPFKLVKNLRKNDFKIYDHISHNYKKYKWNIKKICEYESKRGVKILLTETYEKPTLDRISYGGF